MSVAILVAASNGITITTSMICCAAFLYKHRWPQLKARPLVATTLIITLTVLCFGLQLVYPDFLQYFRRDLAGLKAGEWWRIITPLFVQPQGIYQFLFNMIFLSMFLPMAERLYGRATWLLYFIPGVVGQCVNYFWSPAGGGSSTAAFGIMGSLLMYILIHRKNIPQQYWWFALLGICGALMMCFNRDGHGPGLLAGALLAVLIWCIKEKSNNSV
jgi:rhomboid protease GluP